MCLFACMCVVKEIQQAAHTKFGIWNSPNFIFTYNTLEASTHNVNTRSKTDDSAKRQNLGFNWYTDGESRIQRSVKIG